MPIHEDGPPTTIERYYTLHYGLGNAKIAGTDGRDGADTCVARHHNGICVVCLSPEHPVCTKRKRVTAIEYRSELKAVRGKRKRGGNFVEGRTRLCSVTCESGEVYNVLCTVRGVLVEYNVALQSSPQLLQQKPLTNGYLAVILPRPSEIKTATDALCDADTYKTRNGNNDSSQAPAT